MRRDRRLFPISIFVGAPEKAPFLKMSLFSSTVSWKLLRAASRLSRRAQVAFEESMLIFYYKHYAAVTPPLLGALVVFGIRLRLAWTLLRERLARPGTRAAPAKA